MHVCQWLGACRSTWTISVSGTGEQRVAKTPVQRFQLSIGRKDMPQPQDRIWARRSLSGKCQRGCRIGTFPNPLLLHALSIIPGRRASQGLRLGQIGNSEVRDDGHGSSALVTATTPFTANIQHMNPALGVTDLQVASNHWVPVIFMERGINRIVCASFYVVLRIH